MQLIKAFTTLDLEYHQALILRYETLRKPLGLNYSVEDLIADENDFHLGVFDEDKILATLTITYKKNGFAKMRQVAVYKEWQNKGIGKKLVLAAEKFCIENKFSTLFCHARNEAKSFYQSLGYKIVGDEFMEVGIAHFYMEKVL